MIITNPPILACSHFHVINVIVSSLLFAQWSVIRYVPGWHCINFATLDFVVEAKRCLMNWDFFRVGTQWCGLNLFSGSSLCDSTHTARLLHILKVAASFVFIGPFLCSVSACTGRVGS